VAARGRQRAFPVLPAPVGHFETVAPPIVMAQCGHSSAAIRLQVRNPKTSLLCQSSERALMSIKRLPRIAFDLDLLPGRFKLLLEPRTRKDLVRRFEQPLSKHFGRVRVVQLLFPPVSVIKLTLNGTDFAVGIGRRRRTPNRRAWLVAIDPFVPRNLSNEELRKYAKDLMLISDKVHATATSIPGITRLRWYFEGWDLNTPTVGTPADLPWHVDIPELRGVEDQKLP
jgi:hypothetical protein